MHTHSVDTAVFLWQHPKNVSKITSEHLKANTHTL